ncbi:MAG: hypothetical protein A3D92_17925, partial [Bacteroidetes bacterium RIFCSPHIGHO2_02_FULL_44_7]
ETLKKYFQYPEEKTTWMIIDDDPASTETREYIRQQKDFEIKLFNEKNKGLGYSLNRVYAEIDTEYVFHSEDDWEYLRSIPVLRMIEALKSRSDLSQMLLFRERIKENEYVGARQEEDVPYAEYYRVFSFNSHLARTSLFLENYPFPLNFTEWEYTFKLRKRGHTTSGIWGYKKEYFVRHIGPYNPNVKSWKNY